jgi:hypothetical protein
MSDEKKWPSLPIVKKTDEPKLEELKAPEELKVHDIVHHIAGKQMILNSGEEEQYRNLIRKLQDTQADRPISEISLNDSYWEIKKQLDSFINSH